MNKDWKRLLPGLVISVLSIAAVLYFADVRKTVAALKQANFLLVAIVILISVGWMMMRALAWRTLLKAKAGYSQVLLSVAEGYLLNNLLPFRLGEVGRAFLLGRKAQLAFWEVFPTIIIERILDLAFAAGLLFGTLSFVVGMPQAEGTALGAAAIVLAGLLILYLLARYQEQTLTLVNRISQRFPFSRRFLGTRLQSFFAGLDILTDTKRFLAAVFFMFLNWLIAVIQYTLLLRAFVPGAPWLWGMFSLAIASFGIAAPSSPGALGVLELSIIGALAVFRVEYSTALAFALTIRLINYLLSGGLGSFAFSQEGETLAKLYRRIRGLAENPEGSA